MYLIMLLNNTNFKITILVLNLELLIWGAYNFFKFYNYKDCYYIYTLCNLSSLNSIIPILTLLLIWPQLLIHSITSLLILSYSINQLYLVYSQDDKVCINNLSSNYKSILYYFFTNIGFLFISLVLYLIVYIHSLKRHFDKKNNQILNLNINDIESIESIDINHKNENLYEDEIESNSNDDDITNNYELENKKLLGRKNKKRRICNL